MISDLHDAVFARLESVQALNGKGADMVRLDANGVPVRATYWVLSTNVPQYRSDRLAAAQSLSSDADAEFAVRCVSINGAGVRALIRAVMDALVGFRPTLAGRAVTGLQLDDSTQVDADWSTNPPLFYADLIFTAHVSRV